MMGSLDSKINGGVEKYLLDFVRTEFINSDHKSKIFKLIDVLKDHVNIVRPGLKAL